MSERLKNWSLMRIARLIIGLVIVGSSAVYHEPLLAVVGGLYIGRILLNIGCGPAGCELPSSRYADEREPKDSRKPVAVEAE